MDRRLSFAAAAEAAAVPHELRVTDVTLRDGLQTLAASLPLATKLRVYHYLKRCRVDRIELTSLIPNRGAGPFADAEELLRLALATHHPGDPELMVFTPNAKGLARLAPYAAAGVPWVSTVVATSDAFNRANLRAGTAELMERLPAFVALARQQGRRVRLYLSTAFGCPFTGEVAPAALHALLGEIGRLNVDELALSDSIGTAAPDAIRRAVDAARRYLPLDRLALHLHGRGAPVLACVAAARGLGVTRFDGALSGLGGCPAAPAPTGNVASESLLRLVSAAAGTAGDAAALYLHEQLGMEQCGAGGGAAVYALPQLSEASGPSGSSGSSGAAEPWRLAQF